MEFSTVQLGVDVATSLAILASAITFMVNQRLKARETKRRQLDESVRAVTVDEFQSALGELSGIYVKEIVERATPPAELGWRGAGATGEESQAQSRTFRRVARVHVEHQEGHGGFHQFHLCLQLSDLPLARQH